MVHGIVDVTTTEGETWVAAVDAGFLSVAGNRISILSEHAQMSHDIDLEKAAPDLERARAAGENDDEAARGRRAGLGRGPDPGRRAERPSPDGPADGPAGLRTGREPSRRGSHAAVAVGRRHSSASLLLLVLLYGLGLVVRRRWITRDGGTFELSHRTASGGSGDDSTGPARLGPGARRATPADVLEFFRIFSLLARARGAGSSARTWPTPASGAPQGMEAHALYAGHVIVACSRPSRGVVELAMAPDALTGFLAWLEAAPPGRAAGSR